MPISEFWVTIGDRLFFSQCHWARLFFLAKIRARIFFSKKKNPSPPSWISNGPCLMRIELLDHLKPRAVGYIKRETSFSHQSLGARGVHKFHTFFYRDYATRSTWLRCAEVMTGRFPIPGFKLTNINSFDFSTLYTTMSHKKLNNRLATVIRNSFITKNRNRRYKFLVLGREEHYFVQERSESNIKYTEEDIINMSMFLVDNIFVGFMGKAFQ